MSFAHRIHPALNLAAFRFTDSVSVAQATRAFIDYCDDPQFDPLHVMVSDSREVITVEADLHRILYSVANLVPRFRRFPAGTRSIVLVPDDRVLSHVRMLQKALSWTSPIRLFTTFSEEDAMALSGHPGLALDRLLPGFPARVAVQP